MHGVHCTNFYVYGKYYRETQSSVFSLQVNIFLMFLIISYFYLLSFFVCFILKIHIISLEIIQLYLCYLKDIRVLTDYK